MKLILELHIKKHKIDAGIIGPVLAPYGININKVVLEINKQLEKGEIAINSKVPIEVDLETRSWQIIKKEKKITELLKALVKDNKIRYLDLENYVIKTYKTLNQKEIDKKLHDLIGTCKSMHLEIIK